MTQLGDDWGMPLKGHVKTYSSGVTSNKQERERPAKAHTHRHAMDPETRESGELDFQKVHGSANPADVLTKHVPGNLINEHTDTLGQVFVEGRAAITPALVGGGI